MPSSRTETRPPGGADALPADGWPALLYEARERTLALVAGVSEQDMNRVHDPLMSPLVWDLGHIAAFEDLWLCRRAGGLASLRPELDRVYDADETPRAGRGSLPYLRLADALEYMRSVRERALDVLEQTDLGASGGALTRDGLVCDLVVRHEHQHNETMLQTLRLAPAGTYAPDRAPLRSVAAAAGPDMVRVDAGPFVMGADAEGFAYDNERPRLDLDLPAFEIDRLPVTNADYLEFVEAGGYRRRELWSDAGWAWREEQGAERPLYWTDDGHERSFERVEPLDPGRPVMHVCWHEAEAYARHRDKRLPTEAEWEKAAAWDAALACSLRYPWGDDPPTPSRANLDQLAFGPAPAGALPAGGSPCGALGMVGDAWEWTATEFDGYPGFRAFPYREYSEVFFGRGYRVLRGGSWATRPRAVRNSFRNWDLPERRQIHAGFRCAAGAA